MAHEIEVFRTGTHTSSEGFTREWTEEDLERIAQTYNDQSDHEAPVVLGHPRDNAPAYGWVESLSVKKGVLLAKLANLSEDFVEWVKAGRYKKRSIALYADGLLRHVGFLGAMPPAVKGLKDVAFNDGKAEEYQFGDYRMSTVARVFSRIREWLISKGDSIEDVDKIVPTYDLDSLAWDVPEIPTYLSEELAVLRAQVDDLQAILLAKPSYSENRPMADQTKETTVAQPHEYAEQISALQAKNTTLEAENTAMAGRIDLLEKQAANLHQQNLEASFREFLDSAEMKKRVTPAMRDMAMDELRMSANQGEFQFSDGKKESALERKKALMLTWPVQVEFEERATNQRAIGQSSVAATGFVIDERSTFDPERRDLTTKANTVAKEKNISFSEALDIVLAQG